MAGGYLGVDLGRSAFDDDGWTAKLALLLDERLPVISFTFGCADPQVISAVQGAASEAWVTVTTGAEARHATAAGADVLVVQGSEAGAHRGSFTDDPAEEVSGALGLLSLLPGGPRFRQSRPCQPVGRPYLSAGWRAASGRDRHAAGRRGASRASAAVRRLSPA
jgi:NAD(P)H-dependent flavin oxidoreductase YrpB (nitropropane dioxygenase family)